MKVGDDVWLTVVEIHGGKVRIGIDAPLHVKVFREELLPEDERKGGRNDGQDSRIEAH